jgi:hypothetical protein
MTSRRAAPCCSSTTIDSSHALQQQSVLVARVCSSSQSLCTRTSQSRHATSRRALLSCIQSLNCHHTLRSQKLRSYVARSKPSDDGSAQRRLKGGRRHGGQPLGRRLDGRRLAGRRRCGRLRSDGRRHDGRWHGRQQSAERSGSSEVMCMSARVPKGLRPDRQ